MIKKIKDDVFISFQMLNCNTTHSIKDRLVRYEIIDYLRKIAPDIKFKNGAKQQIVSLLFRKMPHTYVQLRYLYGIIIEDILINDVVKGKYMSQVTCYQNGQMEKIKASAFDGILIALNYRCPIYIRTGLLERQVFPTPSNDSISLPINTLSIELLEEALNRAVECENYELASQLRDEINRRK